MIRKRFAPALIAAVLAAACVPSAPPTPPASSDQPSSSPSPPGPRYTEVLAHFDAAIAQTARLSSEEPSSVMRREELAGLWLQRAQLSGRYEDYAEAGRILEQARAAGGASAPCLSLVRYRLSVHRVREAKALLAECGGADPAALGALAAEIAFDEGDYPRSLQQFRDSLALNERPGALTQLSILHARLGHHSEAAALLDRVAALYRDDSPHFHAWLELQRGLLELERGRLDAASSHYHRADRYMPDWWLVQEHLAEVQTLRHRDAEARATYERIVETTGHPEFMDALVAIAHTAHDDAEARRWTTRAAAEYQRRLALLPEASYGHALDHYLMPGGDPAMALDLARRNLEQRPNGEARIQLAEALLLNHQVQLALEQIRLALDSGWDTAALHVAASTAFQANGDAEAAGRHRQLALERNPLAFKMYGASLAPP